MGRLLLIEGTVMRPDLIEIAVLPHGDTNRLEVSQRGALVSPSETRVEDAFLADVVAEVAMLAAEAPDGTAIAARLARLGRVLSRQLLPAAVRRVLDETHGATLHLRLDPVLRDIPWELCHDGRAFLADTHRVGRRADATRPSAPPARSGPLRVLFVADLDGRHAGLTVEGEKLCLELDAVPGVDASLVGGPNVGRVALLAALADHDVAYLLGEVHLDATGERCGWPLVEGVLTARDLARLTTPPLIAFTRGMRVGALPPAYAFGEALTRVGVPGAIGTLFDGPEGDRVELARVVATALVGGADLGAALQRGRAALAGEPAALAMFLYGDPSWSPRPGGASEPAGDEEEPAPRLRHGSLPVDTTARIEPPRVRRAPAPRPPAADLVGRTNELALLREHYRRALGGERQVVLVSGPAGIGKTALLDAFLGELRAEAATWVGCGQSVERYGAGEAYLPVLQALGAICVQPGGEVLAAQLRQQAPTWLVELPAIADETEREALARRAHGATRERMLRELAELVALATGERPLVLVLEDLHWADVSTLELVSYLALRREPARLLLVGTHRPLETVPAAHPLRHVAQELQARRRCTELRLTPLGRAHTAAHLGTRLTGARVSDDLVAAVHGRTDGHPLFLVSVVDHALRQGLLLQAEGEWSLAGGSTAVEAIVPDGLRQMIERQVDALAPEDRQLLEAASVVGTECGAAAVAAALELDLDGIEERLEGLAGRFLEALDVDEWPDGTMAGHYRFRHALYQNVLYARVSDAGRVRLHRRIGARLERAHAGRTATVAGALAAHFEAGHDTPRAIRHRREAAAVAIGRHADREAIGHLERALQLVPALTDADERIRVELELLVALATPLMSVEGYAAREVERLFDRAHALSRQIDDGPHLYPLLRGLISFFQVRGDSRQALPVGERLLALVERGDDRVALVQACYGHGVTLYNLGEVAASTPLFERALALYDPATHRTHVSVYGGYDPGVGCRAWIGWSRELEGFPEEGARWCREAEALALELGHPLTLAFAHGAAIRAYASLGDLAGSAAASERAVAVAREHGLAFQLAVAEVAEAWTALRRGDAADGIAHMRRGIEAVVATSGRAMLPLYQNQLGIALAMAGQFDDAWKALDEALAQAEATSQPLPAIDIHVARGDLHLRASGARAGGADAAEGSYRTGLSLARARRLRAPELRLAVRLARLLRERGDVEGARHELAPVYDWFRDRTETRTVRQARQELDLIDAAERE
jgi:tetratricopeptide (TPR) repeat protein